MLCYVGFRGCLEYGGGLASKSNSVLQTAVVNSYLESKRLPWLPAFVRAHANSFTSLRLGAAHNENQSDDNDDDNEDSDKCIGALS